MTWRKNLHDELSVRNHSYGAAGGLESLDDTVWHPPDLMS